MVLLGIAAFAAFGGSRNDSASSAPPAVPITVSVSTAPSTTTMPETSTSTTTATAAPTTTMPATVEVVMEVCESLRSEGFETRRVVVDALVDAFAAVGGQGDGRREVGAECGDELGRFEGAVAIRDRMQAIDIAEESEVFAMSLTDFSCGAGTFTVTVTNESSTPLGLHANFVMYRNGDRDDAIQSSFTPIVIWSLEPGESEIITDRFTDTAQELLSCGFDAQIFDADASPADASMGSTPDDVQLTGDDPSAWFPALHEFERAALASGDIDLVASIADVRSMSYDETALAISERQVLPETEVLEVCERGRSQRDPDRTGFVYLERLDDGRNRLRHAIFRRGADGQWRSLSTPRYYESFITNDCSGVDPE